MEDSAHTYSHVLIGLAIGLLIGTSAGYFVGTWQMMQGFRYLHESPSDATNTPALAPTPQATTQPSETATTSAATQNNPLQNVQINPFN